MKIETIQQYKSAFDVIVRTVKDDDGKDVEVWYARELQKVLGYSRWENFAEAIGRSIESCKTLNVNVDDHFREVTKMIALAKGAHRPAQRDLILLCHCFLFIRLVTPIAPVGQTRRHRWQPTHLVPVIWG